jgi:hypothetical protein
MRDPILDLIRPDGYIAYRSLPADKEPLVARLSRLFLPR